MHTPDTGQPAWQCTVCRCGRVALTGCGITLLLLFWSATILAVIFIF